MTKQPIEGAYVVAIYREQVVSMAAMNSWCVKTRGMYTGKDGKFRFPVENLKGNSPLYAGAIKPGYYNGPRYSRQRMSGRSRERKPIPIETYF